MGRYYVYILASQTRVLYVGVTNDIARRITEHRTGIFDGFTKRYRVTRLVYIEVIHDVAAALDREKQIKGWRREKKLELVELTNPDWSDLSLEW